MHAPRYVHRLANRYQQEGVAGLVSKKRGIISNRWLDETIRATAIELNGAHYRDFSPTLANEKLTEMHSIWLSVESALVDYNGRFAVKPKDTTDAHFTYPDTPAALVNILSAQVTKSLSKIHYCQHENMLLQVATVGTGVRGAKVTVHEHFDGKPGVAFKKGAN